jgi:hypothetical protein
LTICLQIASAVHHELADGKARAAFEHLECWVKA